MKKAFFSKIGIFFAAIFIVFFPYVYGEEINPIVVQNITEEEKLKLDEIQKKEILNTIKELSDEIRQNLKLIDEKVENIKKQEEYKKYPAIRLNIDTPMFGLTFAIEQRLQIKKGISTGDVASGYNIKDIVTNSSIKLPELEIAGFVVSTRDVKMDENISFADANICVVKLTQYIEQLESTQEFIDTQINRFFSFYVDKQKKDSLNNISLRLSTLNDKLLETDDVITYLYILNIDENIYNGYIDEYTKISKEIKEIKFSTSNILISKEDIESSLRKTVDLEGRLLDFSKKINDNYANSLKDINIDKVLLSTKKNMLERKNRLENYVKDSVKKQEIKTDGIEKSEDINDKIYEDKEQYSVVSKEILTYLNSILMSIDENIKKYLNEPIQVSNEVKNGHEEVVNKEQVTKVTLLEFSEQDKQKVLEQVKILYDEFLLRENKFYLDNINYSLKDTSYKLTMLANNSDKNVLSQIKYVYLDMPKAINVNLKDNNLSSNIELKIVTDKIYNELNNLIQNNIKITKLYNENIS
ncbi:MAG: hypothetical protein RSB67_01530 [Clostridia bacterium]